MMDRLQWSEELWMKAQSLRNSGKGNTEIADLLGLTARQVKNRFYHKDRTRAQMDNYNAACRENRATLRGREPSPYKSPYSWPAPSSTAIADRNTRLATPPRDLTAVLMGDPRPGWSALEKRA